MSVNDHRQYPWLEKEKAFIQLGKPLLGICLGAQLIASVCGAQIYPNPQKEIGWYPIQSVSGNQSDKFKFDEALTVFHWHGETFDLPQDAKWLACSDACLHQAFSLGSNALALQFHLETTIELSKALIENCADELLVSEYIQSAETMQSVPVVLYERANQALFELLDTLLGTN
jgi:GMP synthase-like glutamine amidotransferase